MSSLNLEAVRVSGSQLDRVVRCEASAALPQVVNEDDNDGRERGHAVHKFLERVPELGREVALAETDEKHRALCGDIELAKLADRLSLSREVPIAYNWKEDTARLLVRGEDGRLLVDRSCEVAMILDLVGSADRAVYVGDYKTGYGWLPDPDRSFQLGAGAVAAARLFGARRAYVEYLRIRDDGTVRRKFAELDLFAIDETAASIAAALRRAHELRLRVLDGFVPNVVEGPWCKHCPAKQHCPAKTALIRHVMSDPQPVPYTIPLTPEIALNAYVMLKRAKEGLKDIESAIYAYAKTTPLFLGHEEDGVTERWFGEFTRDGNDVLDGAVVHSVMTARYGGEEANKAVTMESTKKAIGDVVRRNLAPDQKITKVIDAVIEQVREAGGITNPTTTTTVEHTVAPDGKSKARKRRSA